MKKILVLLFALTASVNVTHADTWVQPTEKDYYSATKMFVAHVTPAKPETKAKLEVFQIKDSQKIPLWDCALGNEGAPQQVFISDGGEYVATVNEVSDRVHGGLGDYVVAFYNKAGPVKNYSLEQILHYPDKIDKNQFRKLTSRSVSGRAWASMPMILDRHSGKLYFCVWLFYGRRWLAWEVSSGEEVEISDQMTTRWNEKGRLWAREHGIQSKYCGLAARFLGALKNDEDRGAIRSLLADTRFHTSPVGKWKAEFIRYEGRCPGRALAESILAGWDGRPAKEPGGIHQKYYYLGVVEGTIKLPRPPEAGDRWLCIYLIPGTIAESKWYSAVPVHRVTAYFGKYSFSNSQWPGDNIAFRIEGITPGEYWVKAVWDKAKPYNFEDNYIKGPPQEGDYQSIKSPVITVKAGEKFGNIIVDCTHEVADGAD